VHGSLLLIRGPDWNRKRVEQLEQMIQRVDATLQSQERAGRPFTSNHLTVGRLHLKRKHSQEVLQFVVSILEEIPGEGNHSHRRVVA
jgi:hypothetical protein